jgi:hypothetical protein
MNAGNSRNTRSNRDIIDHNPSKASNTSSNRGASTIGMPETLGKSARAGTQQERQPIASPMTPARNPTAAGTSATTGSTAAAQTIATSRMQTVARMSQKIRKNIH